MTRFGTFLGFLGWSCRSCLRSLPCVCPTLQQTYSQEAQRQSTEIEGLRRGNLPSSWPCGLAVRIIKVNTLITSGGSAERHLVHEIMYINIYIYTCIICTDTDYIPKGSDRLRKLKTHMKPGTAITIPLRCCLLLLGHCIKPYLASDFQPDKWNFQKEECWSTSALDFNVFNRCDCEHLDEVLIGSICMD